MNIVGFSHGGNVGIQVSQMTSRKIDNLVTLGTPARSDYKPNYSMIGAHYNAYSTKDAVQISGGGQLNASMVKGYVKCGLVCGFLGWLKGEGEFGPAGRTYESAENINTTLERRAFGVSPHGYLWSDPHAWEQVDSIFNQ